MRSNNTNRARKLYKDFFGHIPNGFHIHHILPVALGGTDTIGNLIAVHPDDHWLLHKYRGDKLTSKGLLSVAGRPMTEETKQKISKRHKGRVAPNKGQPNEVAKARMLSEHNPMKNPEVVNKVRNKLIGKPSVNKITDTINTLCEWCAKVTTRTATVKNRRKRFCNKSCSVSYSNRSRACSAGHCEI